MPSLSLSVGHLLKFVWDLLLPLTNLWNNGGTTGMTAAKNVTLALDLRIQSYESNILSKDIGRVAFYLYPDPTNLNYTELLVLGKPESVLSSRYKPELPLILLIHGFLTNSSDGFAQTVKDAFLETKYPGNIVVVEWGNLSTPTGPTPYLHYNLAVANVPPVANRTKEFILFLLEIQAVTNPASVQIIGFSLGAHVAGMAGQGVNTTVGKPIGRITGLDPAAPGFHANPEESKLDSSDASFVDVYHTNQGLKGYPGLLGHVDFFPNGGGPFQPGCSNISDFSDVFTGTCSHARAYKYFAKSIRNSTITACKCEQKRDISWTGAFRTRPHVDPECKSRCMEPIVFGQFCPNSARGVYYIQILP